MSSVLIANLNLILGLQQCDHIRDETLETLLNNYTDNHLANNEEVELRQIFSAFIERTDAKIILTWLRNEYSYSPEFMDTCETICEDLTSTDFLQNQWVQNYCEYFATTDDMLTKLTSSTRNTFRIYMDVLCAYFELSDEAISDSFEEIVSQKISPSNNQRIEYFLTKFNIDVPIHSVMETIHNSDEHTCHFIKGFTQACKITDEQMEECHVNDLLEELKKEHSLIEISELFGETVTEHTRYNKEWIHDKLRRCAQAKNSRIPQLHGLEFLKSIGATDEDVRNSGAIGLALDVRSTRGIRCLMQTVFSVHTLYLSKIIDDKLLQPDDNLRGQEYIEYCRRRKYLEDIREHYAQTIVNFCSKRAN